MSSESWYRQKIIELQNKDSRLNALADIKNQLYNQNPEVTIAMNFLKSPELFMCLDGTDSGISQSDLVLEILSICMSALDLDRSDYAEFLNKSLTHSNVKVKSLALNEIVKYLRKNPTITSLDPNLIHSLIKCLDTPETSVGALTIEILSQILKTNIDDYQNIKEELMKKCTSNDVVRCRVYEICVNLAKFSSTNLSEVEQILNKMLIELDNKDILLQLNVLELLVSLAEQNHGLVYLESKLVFEKISRRIETILENQLESILIPGFMKFFGKIAFNQPQKIILGFPNMIQCLFDCLLSDDVSILPTAFDTLGNLAHSSQGKILLDKNYSEKLVECFQKISIYLTNLPTDLKIRGFIALEIIFKTEGVISKEIHDITKKWYQHLSGSENFDFLYEFCKNPFPDIKNASLLYMKTLCMYQWGIKAFKDTAGLIEYMLDRRVEFDKDTFYIKYEINKILSETTIFDAQTLLQLKKYVEEGAHYVEGIVEVAVEGS